MRDRARSYLGAGPSVCALPERTVTAPSHTFRAGRPRCTIARMRRTLATTAAILTAFLLAGCSSSGPSADQKKYADAVAVADPDDFGGIATDDLANTLGSEGTDICKQLKISFADAAAYAKLARSEKEATALIAAAVVVYCPDQKSKLPAS